MVTYQSIFVQSVNLQHELLCEQQYKTKYPLSFGTKAKIHGITERPSSVHTLLPHACTLDAVQ